MTISNLGSFIALGSFLLAIVLWMALALAINTLLFKCSDTGFAIGTSFVIGFVIAAFAAYMFFSNVFECESKMEYSHSYSIYAMEDGMQVRGGRYYIQQDSYYYYLADYKDGKKRYAVPTHSSYIVEDKSETPHIEVYKVVPLKKSWKSERMFQSTQREYKIVVPEKTLTDEFNIDLK